MSKKISIGFLIHLSGTGCISDVATQKWNGDENLRVWNDVSDIQAIHDLPDSAYHHKIDREIMDASNELIKTVIICPPDVYGQNTGVGNRSSFLVPEYVKYLVEGKQPFYLGNGENWRAVSHMDDVVDLFVILTREAVRGGGRADWGKEVSFLHIYSSIFLLLIGG
jgi:nucleoside-diphosphate-sugar epimerase